MRVSKESEARLGDYFHLFSLHFPSLAILYAVPIATIIIYLLQSHHLFISKYLCTVKLEL